MKNIIKNILYNLGKIVTHSVTVVWEIVTLSVLFPISWILLKASGWKLIGDSPGVPQFVLALAPHRQGGGDIVRGLYVKTLLGFRFTLTLMKYEAFLNPIVGGLLRFVGGLPVDRQHTQGQKVKGTSKRELIALFKKHPYLELIITPEGTRKHVPWNSGFYKIARGANVPIVLATFDYEAKRVVLSKPIMMTWDIDKDFETIKRWYLENSSGHEVLLNTEDFV